MGWWVAEVAREALFVFEQEAFVAGIEVNGFEAAGGAVGADGAHEAEGFRDAIDNAGVLRFYAFVFDMAELPVKRRV